MPRMSRPSRACHREPEIAVGREGAVNLGDQTLALQAEHSQASQEDLDYPSKQEDQQPPIPEKGAAAQQSDTPCRDVLSVGDERVFLAHFVPLLARHSYAANPTTAA